MHALFWSTGRWMSCASSSNSTWPNLYELARGAFCWIPKPAPTKLMLPEMRKSTTVEQPFTCSTYNRRVVATKRAGACVHQCTCHNKLSLYTSVGRVRHQQTCPARLPLCLLCPCCRIHGSLYLLCHQGCFNKSSPMYLRSCWRASSWQGACQLVVGPIEIAAQKITSKLARSYHKGVC